MKQVQRKQAYKVYKIARKQHIGQHLQLKCRTVRDALGTERFEVAEALAAHHDADLLLG